MIDPLNKSMSSGLAIASARCFRGHGPWNRIDALAQPEKRQDCENDDDCANEVDDAIHDNSLRVG